MKDKVRLNGKNEGEVRRSVNRQIRVAVYAFQEEAMDQYSHTIPTFDREMSKLNRMVKGVRLNKNQASRIRALRNEELTAK